MKTMMIPVMLTMLLLLAIGCSDPAEAEGPWFVSERTLSTSITFVALQDSLASTTKKIAYVLAVADTLEVAAWRYEISSAAREWVRVLPTAAAISSGFSDSVMTCPIGYVLPIEGSFDALTLKGKSTGGLCQIQAYK